MAAAVSYCSARPYPWLAYRRTGGVESGHRALVTAVGVANPPDGTRTTVPLPLERKGLSIMSRQAIRKLGTVLEVLAAVFTLATAMTAAPTQAHSIDDWTAASGPGTSNCRYPASWYGSQAYADFGTCWSGTTVWVRAYAQDTRDGDGYCGVAQINYQLDADRNGVWDGHTHTRSTEVACYAPWGDQSSWCKSHHPIRNLVGRACVGGTDGSAAACDSWRSTLTS